MKKIKVLWLVIGSSLNEPEGDPGDGGGGEEARGGSEAENRLVVVFVHHTALSERYLWGGVRESRNKLKYIFIIRLIVTARISFFPFLVG